LMDVETAVIGGGRANVDEFKGDYENDESGLASDPPFGGLVVVLRTTSP
jgi:hypothetical protein